MILSMTAFARTQTQAEWGNFVCEMRSINHRYLEISLHLPEILRVFEMPLRECIRQYVKRGKVECAIRYQANSAAGGASFAVNTALVNNLSKAAQEVASLLTSPAPISATDILRFPGVMETKDADVSQLQKEVFQLLETTLKDLVAARQREGEELKQTFLQRLDLMQQELAKVRSRLPQVLIDQRDKLIKRFTEAKVELDPNRLEQEMVIFAQKIDVAEEIDRTETHIAEIRRILKQDGMAGRRLDFLLQELNREANTMGSKSSDSTITHAAVEMKVLIEQIREQVQNIE